jgi:outer membrane protein assembly factor BamE (lipoprotein component of BamABCDE complex)
MRKTSYCLGVMPCMLCACACMVFVICFVGCEESVPPIDTVEGKTATKQTATAPVIVETQPSLVVAKKWAQIKSSMRPQEVVKILGNPHRDITDSMGDDYHFFRYEWDEAGTTYYAYFTTNCVLYTKTRPTGTPFKPGN